VEKSSWVSRLVRTVYNIIEGVL